jgi:hypothetical protein
VRVGRVKIENKTLHNGCDLLSIKESHLTILFSPFVEKTDKQDLKCEKYGKESELMRRVRIRGPPFEYRICHMTGKREYNTMTGEN